MPLGTTDACHVLFIGNSTFDLGTKVATKKFPELLQTRLTAQLTHGKLRHSKCVLQDSGSGWLAE